MHKANKQTNNIIIYSKSVLHFVAGAFYTSLLNLTNKKIISRFRNNIQILYNSNIVWRRNEWYSFSFSFFFFVCAKYSSWKHIYAFLLFPYLILNKTGKQWSKEFIRACNTKTNKVTNRHWDINITFLLIWNAKIHPFTYNYIHSALHFISKIFFQ